MPPPCRVDSPGRCAPHPASAARIFPRCKPLTFPRSVAPPVRMRTYVRMTSQGSPYARFQRALRIGRLSLVRAAAAELPRIDLADALSICLLIEQQDEERFERAAVRWLARLSLEAPTVGIEDLRQGLVAFEALPHNPLGARRALADLCGRHGLRRAAAAMEATLDGGAN